MRKITFSQATQEAMAETMARDPTVFAMGEDLARQGGIFGQFKGLPQQFPGRIIDTPISETFIIGGGVGAALAGTRPVVDMHFADFIGVPMDEIFNQMAKVRYMFGGQAKVPLVLRAPDGSAGGGAAQHQPAAHRKAAAHPHEDRQRPQRRRREGQIERRLPRPEPQLPAAGVKAAEGQHQPHLCGIVDEG